MGVGGHTKAIGTEENVAMILGLVSEDDHKLRTTPRKAASEAQCHGLDCSCVLRYYYATVQHTDAQRGRLEMNE